MIQKFSDTKKGLLYMSDGLCLDNFEFIEVPVNTTGTALQQLNFPDQPNLRYAPVLGITAYTVDTVPNSFLSGNALPSIAQIQQGCLTLYTGQQDGSFKEGIKRIPLVDLLNLNNVTAGQPFNYFLKSMRGQTVQWEKSYISFATAQTFASVVSFCFGIYYPSVDFQGQTSR